MRFLLLLSAVLLSFPAPHHLSFADDRPVKPRKSRVLFIVRDSCPECDRVLSQLRKPGGPFEAMSSVGWKIGSTPDCHVQVVHADVLVEFAESLKITDYPAVAGIHNDEVVRYFKTGCTTPLDAWTFGWLLTGKNERPHAEVAEAVQVATTGSYRLRGNHWSVDGDWNPSKPTVLAHLRGPNHASSAAAYSAIESWSLEELRSLHDDLHEREGTWSSGAGVAGGATTSVRSTKPAYMVPKALR